MAEPTTLVAPEPPPPSEAPDSPAAGFGTVELPQNVEAEQALLGAIMLNNAAFESLPPGMEPDHFYIPVHGRIFDAIRTLIAHGQLATPVTLKSYFAADDGLADIGGTQYLARLAGGAASIVSAPDYAAVILDMAMRRNQYHLFTAMAGRAVDPSVHDTAAALTEEAEAALFALAEGRADGGGARGMTALATEALKQWEAARRRGTGLAGLATGLRDVDAKLGGMAPGDLVIVAGRPSMGKSALGHGIALVAAHEGTPAMIATLEDTGIQVMGRIMAAETGLASDKLRRGTMDNDEFTKVVMASRSLASLPLFVDDTPALSVAALHSRARGAKRRDGIGLLVVDYLQLMTSGGGRDSGRYELITGISQGLKRIAKDLDIPIVALSQLSRAVEAREDKRPLLSDLRDSGSIEQDADAVLFLYREEYYLERAEPNKKDGEELDRFDRRKDEWRIRLQDSKGRADVDVAKNRHGPIGKARVAFDAELTRFSNLAHQEDML